MLLPRRARRRRRAAGPALGLRGRQNDPPPSSRRPWHRAAAVVMPRRRRPSLWRRDGLVLQPRGWSGASSFDCVEAAVALGAVMPLRPLPLRPLPVRLLSPPVVLLLRRRSATPNSPCGRSLRTSPQRGSFSLSSTYLSALTLTPLPSRVSFTLLLYFSLSMVGGIFIRGPYVGCTQGGNFWNANKDAR